MGQEVIVVANGKGGAGKSPTAVALAYTYTRAGKRVLLEDVDPQGTASYHLLGLKYKAQEPTMYDLLKDTRRTTRIEPIKIRVSRIPESADYENYFYLLPANDILSNAEVELTTNKAFSFQEHLAKLNRKFYNDFDIIIMDTPGSHIATFVIMAVAAGTKILVPTKTEISAVEGTVDSIHLIEDVKENFNETLSLWGILPTQFESGNKHHQDTLDLLHTYFKDPDDPTGQSYYPVYKNPSLKRNHYNKATEYRCDVREVPNTSGNAELAAYWDELAYDLLTKAKAPVDPVRLARIQGDTLEKVGE